MQTQLKKKESYYYNYQDNNCYKIGNYNLTQTYPAIVSLDKDTCKSGWVASYIENREITCAKPEQWKTNQETYSVRISNNIQDLEIKCKKWNLRYSIKYNMCIK